MSQDQLKAFLEKVKEDEGLQKQLAALPQDDMQAAQEACVAIALESGYDFKSQDLQDLKIDEAEGDLSDDELEGVSGGFWGIPIAVVKALVPGV